MQYLLKLSIIFGESYSGSTPALGAGSPSSILGSPTDQKILGGKRKLNRGRTRAARLNEGEGGTEPRLGYRLAGRTYKTDLNF